MLLGGQVTSINFLSSHWPLLLTATIISSTFIRYVCVNWGELYVRAGRGNLSPLKYLQGDERKERCKGSRELFSYQKCGCYLECMEERQQPSRNTTMFANKPWLQFQCSCWCLGSEYTKHTLQVASIAWAPLIAAATSCSPLLSLFGLKYPSW